ncbi:hypothetical protein QFC20_002837 [Naganishia adeliensis]|uniref:Uncharacterized protein n=1 Tax=Naganishia adeliensis TaxID=92952 RepID=A0ACC2WH89_9TREE|nr:hypothetical protein QFC20_002837 [Naganishia adeliensis]
MSDDFDDLPDDDLFTNPASSLAIEEAVAAAERKAPTHAPQNPVAVGGKPTGKYHHTVAPASSLHLRGRGAQDDDDDEEYGGPEFFADEIGNYFESEVKDVRRQGLDADVLQRGEAGNGQGSFSRSKSFGPASQGAINASSHKADPPNPSSARHTSMNPQRPPPPGSPSLRHPNHAQKPFTRVHSDGENAPRVAIQGVFSASQNTNQPGSQGSVNVRPLASQVDTGSKCGPQQPVGKPQRPSVGAGVTQDDIEALRQQVAQMAKEKKEVEDREKKAVQELWRYQGEVKTVRMKADEEKKHAESKFMDLQNQLSTLEETLKSERLDHRRALDTVQTDHAFKMHNEQSSHVKARFGTQRTRQMQATPSRPNGISTSQQGGASQFPVDNNYAYTPSRSPIKKGAIAPGGSSTRLGSMGPPPVPDLLVSEADTDTPTNSKFPGLLDTFTGDSQLPSHKERNKRKDAEDGGRASPTPSVFEEAQVQNFDMHEETYPLVQEDEGVYMDHAQDVIIVEVNHIIFTHFYTPIWESPSESMKTVRRILTSHSSASQNSFPLFQEKCSSFLEACGNREATPEDFCRDVNHALWDLLNLMTEAEEFVAPATLVSPIQLLSLLCIRIPQYAAVFTAAGYVNACCRSSVTSVKCTPMALHSWATAIHLVPSLVQLAETLADHIWGICARDEDLELRFGVLVSVVTVLHMLVFPPESTSQNTPSVHLRSVIARALESPKEYNGLHHVFITALGRINYAPVPGMKKWTRMQVTTLRYLAQDLLSEPVGGNQREDDAIYAMYVFSEDENASPERNAEEELARDDGPNEEEEAQSYQ